MLGKWTGRPMGHLLGTEGRRVDPDAARVEEGVAATRSLLGAEEGLDVERGGVAVGLDHVGKRVDLCGQLGRKHLGGLVAGAPEEVVSGVRADALAEVSPANRNGCVKRSQGLESKRTFRTRKERPRVPRR